jgi:hypothetical protein
MNLTSEDVIKLFKGTHLAQALLAKQEKLKLEWDSVINPAIHEWKQASNQSDLNGLSYTCPKTVFDDFVWADAMYWSRVLECAWDSEGKGESAWIPLLDTCNHSFQPTSRWDVDCEQDTVQLVPTDHFSRMIADAPCNEPLDLTINYGFKPNSELLFSYGFLERDNPYDTVTIQISLKSDLFTHRLSEVKLEWIEAAQLRPVATIYKRGFPVDRMVDSWKEGYAEWAMACPDLKPIIHILDLSALSFLSFAVVDESAFYTFASDLMYAHSSEHPDAEQDLDPSLIILQYLAESPTLRKDTLAIVHSLLSDYTTEMTNQLSRLQTTSTTDKNMPGVAQQQLHNALIYVQGQRDIAQHALDVVSTFLSM